MLKETPLPTLIALSVAIFLPALFCGFYLDDYSFLRMLENVGPPQLWVEFLHYVPGRNLHILFFYALIHLSHRLPIVMHAVSIAIDGLNTVFVYILAQRLMGQRSVALSAAIIFLVAPNHGETHYWINAIPQNQISTALALGAFILATRPKGPAFGFAAIVYALALFTYDQVFFLWPLLIFAAWKSNHRLPFIRAMVMSIVFIGLNAAHICARYLSPYSNGGRPLIRVHDFLDRCQDAIRAVLSGMFPWPTSSHIHWFWSIPLILVSFALGIGLTRLVRNEAHRDQAGLTAWSLGTGAIEAVLFGMVWTLLAYLPNLFWYLSPRHNLLPSIGWAIALAAVGARVIQLNRRVAALLPAAATLGFVLAVVSNVHEATQWFESKQLMDSFLVLSRRIAPPVDSLFLIDAPRHLRRAPAFNLPQDIVFAGSRALSNTDLHEGDRMITPTRRGILYLNDLSLHAADVFHWQPADKANVIVFDPKSRTFSCASSLQLQIADGLIEHLPLRLSPQCSAVVTRTLSVALIESKPIKVTRPPTTARINGLSLLSANIHAYADTTKIEFEWLVEIPPKTPFAFVPHLKDANGRLMFDSVFPSHSGKHPDPILWPMVDDIAPSLGLKSGQGLRQSFIFRRGIEGNETKGKLELIAYELTPAASKSGAISIDVAIHRDPHKQHSH